MNVLLSQKDLGLISAYLDDRLSQTQKNLLEERFRSEPGLKRNLDELQHTRTLLRSLTPRKAPRNFTLSSQYARFHPRSRVLSLTFGWASGAAAFALIALFAFTSFLPLRAALPMAAPAPAMMNDTALESGTTNPPQIITWNMPNMAYGRGGGGGGGDGNSSIEAPKSAGAESMTLSEPAGGGGMPPVINEPQVEDAAPMTLSDSQVPQQTFAVNESADPSTLILGLPQPGTEGQQINTVPASTSAALFIDANPILWTILLAALALSFALAAILFHRR